MTAAKVHEQVNAALWRTTKTVWLLTALLLGFVVAFVAIAAASGAVMGMIA